MTKHVAVWLDHKEARIFHIHPDAIDEMTVLAPLHNIHHKHDRGAGEPREHPNDAKQFYHDVSRALADSEEILVLGPGEAKFELFKYVHQHEHSLEPKIIGMETVDHPTNGQLVAYAKKHFIKNDRMR
jgi:stalled ribosome rescue protein Dom34